MQLIGQAICHKTFGNGIVTDWNENILTVCFPAGNKKFIYPDAFSGHLTLGNSVMQNRIQQILDKREAEKKAEQQEAREKRERKHLLRTMKISPNSQAVFDITADLKKNLFSAWSVSTGVYLSGYSKGEPRIPDRMKPNSLCLLTERRTGTQEQERRIIGAFMVEESFLGIHCQNGTIKAHPTYRIALKSEDQPAFWPYITKDPAKRRWGNASLKYFSNITAEQILFDIRALPASAEEKTAADQFYRYFCKLNRLPLRQVKESESAHG